MDANEIDEVLNAFNYHKHDVLIRYAGLEISAKDALKGDNYEIIKRRIMDKIEKGDFEHFLSKMGEKRGDYDANFCVDLLCSSSNVELIKSVVDRSKEFNLGFRVVSLIESTKDVAYMKEIIETKGKWQDLGITDNGIAYLIRKTNDQDYIKEKVHNIEELGIKSDSIVKLVRGLHETEIIADLLERREEFELSDSNIIKLLDSIDFETKVELLEKTKYRYFVASSMINEPDKLKNALEDAKKRKKFHLNMGEAVSFFDAVYQSEDVKEIIESKEKREELQLSNNEILALLIKLDEPEFVENFINKKEELELDDDTICKLALLTKDEKTIEDFFSKKEEYDIENTNKIIKLPNSMTIGIEIESEGDMSNCICYAEKLNGWDCMEDGSLLNRG